MSKSQPQGSPRGGSASAGPNSLPPQTAGWWGGQRLNQIGPCSLSLRAPDHQGPQRPFGCCEDNHSGGTAYFTDVVSVGRSCVRQRDRSVHSYFKAKVAPIEGLVFPEAQCLPAVRELCDPPWSSNERLGIDDLTPPLYIHGEVCREVIA